jgi:hypothetical protein
MARGCAALLLAGVLSMSAVGSPGRFRPRGNTWNTPFFRS